MQNNHNYHLNHNRLHSLKGYQKKDYLLVL